ncbi:hypothetical protein Q5Y75_10595 [Ruegeria sp. 2205SS24-7]|uniref:hypothetical protein n=1 Tax=Ruegeria discodermiae TaxID=3064389 RepID=UPI002740410C|nr:hypothetical protein [Ruegeria sp. 2205SS24-7]MDP5217667.1 hypothetical protein [Ruegeria sp. 2205SS24-7]
MRRADNSSAAQLTAQDLAEIGFRKFVEERDLERGLVSRHLMAAMREICSSVTSAPGALTTKALTNSPVFSSGWPMQAHSATPSQAVTAASTDAQVIFWPKQSKATLSAYFSAASSNDATIEEYGSGLISAGMPGSCVFNQFFISVLLRIGAAEW